jgi:CDP-glucose 4,6-dehydratase
MKIIVTGATGFVGGWLVSDLLKDSFDLTIIRYNPKHSYQSSEENPRTNSQYFIKKFDRKCKEVFIDLCDYLSVEKIIKETQAYAVIHMAAVSRVSIAKNNPKHTYELASNGTLNLLEAIRLHSPHTLFISHTSDKVYSGNNVPFHENMLFNPNFIFDAAKISQEYLTKIYAKSYKVRAVSIRSCGYFGGYDFNLHRVIPYVIQCLIKNESIKMRSDGGITRDFLYIKDAVLINRILLNKMSNKEGNFKFGDAFNFSLENTLSVMEIIKKIFEIYGKETKIESVGGGHPLYGSSELPDVKLDCTKAKESLDWQPKYSLEEGIEETIEFYKSFPIN